MCVGREGHSLQALCTSLRVFFTTLTLSHCHLDIAVLLENCTHCSTTPTLCASTLARVSPAGTGTWTSASDDESAAPRTERVMELGRCASCTLNTRLNSTPNRGHERAMERVLPS